MKNMKRLVAALLVLSLALALCGSAMAEAKFTKKQAASGLFVKFTGTTYGYNNHNSGSKSKIIVRKGSVGLLVNVYGEKWGQVIITDGSMNAEGKEKALWFNVDYLKALKDQDSGYISCTFAAGGSGLSMKEGAVTLKALKGVKVKTTGKVNLRKEGSLKGKSLATIKKGEKLTCTGKVAYDSRLVVFMKVKYNGKTGYVSTEYIKNAEDVLFKALEEELGI